MPFTCSICEEQSTRICVGCTKDSCENHLCEKCSRCSDCCGCKVTLVETERETCVEAALAADQENYPTDQRSSVAPQE